MEATRTAIVGRKCVSSADSNAECWLIVDDVNPSLLLRMLLVSSIFYSTQKSVYQYNKLNYTWLSECLCIPVFRHSTTKKLLVIIITYLCYSLYGWFYTSGLSQNPQHHQCILQIHNKKSINQPTNQPANQSINQPTNQSINQSWSTLPYTWYPPFFGPKQSPKIGDSRNWWQIASLSFWGLLCFFL